MAFAQWLSTPTSYAYSLALALFLCLLYSACTAPELPDSKSDGGSGTDSALRVQDSLKNLTEQTDDILDTASLPSNLKEAARYLMTILPNLLDEEELLLDYAWTMFNGQDSIIYVPFMFKHTHHLYGPGLRTGLVLKKLAGADYISSVYLTHKKSIFKGDKKAYDSTVYMDLAFRPSLSIVRKYKEDGVTYEGSFKLPKSPIYHFYTDKEELLRIRAAIVKVLANIETDATLEEMQKQLQEMGGDVDKYLKISARPMDVDLDGEIDDCEITTIIGLKNLKQQTIFSWSSPPYIPLSNVTVTNMNIPFAVQSPYFTSPSDNFFIFSLDPFLNSRKATRVVPPYRLPPVVDCRSKIVKGTVRLASSGGSGYDGAKQGCVRNQSTKLHMGLDIYAEVNTPLFNPIKEASVVKIHNTDDGELGKYVIIEGEGYNGRKIAFLFAHLQGAVNIREGQNILNHGALFALAGRTGNAKDVKNPHTHIKVGLDKDDATKSVSRRLYDAKIIGVGMEYKYAHTLYKKKSCQEVLELLRKFCKKQGLPENFYDPQLHLYFKFDAEGRCTNCMRGC